MKILITGGAGFIGSNLVSYLVRERALKRLVIFDNLSTCSIAYIEEITGVVFGDGSGPRSARVRGGESGAEVELVTGDILDRPLLESACRGVDTIVHLAAHTEVVRSVEHPEESLKINVNGTMNVLECARACGIGKVVFSSSNAAVGEVAPPIHEQVVAQPISPYGAGKACGEALLSAYAGCYGMTTTSLRFANAYGPYSAHKTSVVAKMLREIVRGDDLIVYGDGDQSRDFVHAADIARAVWLALQRDKGYEVFQVASGKGTAINDLVKIICRVTGASPNIAHGPARAGEILRNYSSIGKIHDQLGFEPRVGLEDGIVDLYERLSSKPDLR